ncbi:MAG: D-2-hydroxyacid dehydrogenase [Bacteroidales bacterium]
MKIVFLDAATLGGDADLSPISGLGELILYNETHKDQVVDRSMGADVLIVNKIVINERILKPLSPTLKLICVSATGTNNIDHNAADRYGVAVRNAKDYSTESVAQVTFASLLSLINHIPIFDSAVKSGAYSRSPHFSFHQVSFGELKGQTFGIIGMGNIGRRVAQIAKVFGCHIYYYSTSVTNHCKEYEALTLQQLLATCDIISIHAPLNDRTKNLLTLNELTLMKRSAILINMGRGGIVNEADLAQALNNGVLAGAVVDVYEREPVRDDHPLLHLKEPNKIVTTPHIGWASRQARKSLIEKIAENISQELL